MEQEMRSDVALLNFFCDEAPLVLDRVTGSHVILVKKLIAHWTGLAVQTISDYANGRINIPIRFWRSFLRHHYHPGIVALLLPDDFEWEVHAPGVVEPCTGPDFFREAVREMGAHVEKQTYLAEILADGRVDELDESSVRDYADAYLHHRALDARLHRSILLAYRRAAARKAHAS